MVHHIIKDNPIVNCCHFDGLVEEVHLVDEQVAEYAGTVDDDIDAGTTEFFEGDHLEFVDSSELILNDCFLNSTDINGNTI